MGRRTQRRRKEEEVRQERILQRDAGSSRHPRPAGREPQRLHQPLHHAVPIMKHYLGQSTKTGMVRELMDIREELEQQRLGLIRHLTTLDATLLGILTVFQDRLRPCLFPLSLTAAGMILLFLSLAAGVYHMYMAYRSNEKVYRQLARVVNGREPLHDGFVRYPFGTSLSAKVCPICLCLGVLSLLARVFF